MITHETPKRTVDYYEEDRHEMGLYPDTTGEHLDYHEWYYVTKTWEREYTWACDESGGETTHEGTYGTDGWVLVAYGKDTARGNHRGLYRERYQKQTIEYFDASASASPSPSP